jgi:transcriptional regulator with XRE-family HTH domain
MNSTEDINPASNSASTSKTASIGLPEDIRASIKTARIEEKLSLRALATHVGISAGVLARIESGEKHPTPYLLLKILAALNCHTHFERVIYETPESWIARRLTFKYPRAKDLGPVLQRGRKLAGIEIKKIAELTGAPSDFLNYLESGWEVPPLALLVKIIHAWNLPSSKLQTLFDSTASPGADFAERFIATTFERHGFRVTQQEGRRGIDVQLGGKWHFHIAAYLTEENHDE